MPYHRSISDVPVANPYPYSYCITFTSILDFTLTLTQTLPTQICRPDTWQFANQDEMDPDKSCYVRCSAVDAAEGTYLHVTLCVSNDIFAYNITSDQSIFYRIILNDVTLCYHVRLHRVTEASHV